MSDSGSNQAVRQGRRPACCRRSSIVLATARPQNIVEEVLHVMADRKSSVRYKPGNP